MIDKKNGLKFLACLFFTSYGNIVQASSLLNIDIGDIIQSEDLSSDVEQKYSTQIDEKGCVFCQGSTIKNGSFPHDEKLGYPVIREHERVYHQQSMELINDYFGQDSAISIEEQKNYELKYKNKLKELKKKH
ncbi:hypothetical protein [Zooshikella harenae]|uniref:Cytochrome c domain-containing protein n=1 Tax=Zooshikella harenae TaxID=2827238 RepID=A0ABS5ZDC2_9GAMM|nr:hypothetical protein [Zooshikella harenae]MBU2711270.1 hypothetical protein [Zooshikella harenae]